MLQFTADARLPSAALSASEGPSSGSNCQKLDVLGCVTWKEIQYTNKSTSRQVIRTPTYNWATCIKYTEEKLTVQQKFTRIEDYLTRVHRCVSVASPFNSLRTSLRISIICNEVNKPLVNQIHLNLHAENTCGPYLTS